MSGHDRFRYAAIAALLVCYGTILLGGNVMASDSGLACPDWPTCHGQWLPALAGPPGIEYAHRIAAFALTLSMSLLFGLAVMYERRRPVLLRLAGAAMGLVVAQALLGAIVVFSDLSVGMVLLHLALATALFGLLLLLTLLANLSDIPPRWVDWAYRASGSRDQTLQPFDKHPGGEPIRIPTPSGLGPGR